VRRRSVIADGWYFAEELLADLDKDTVDFQPNFDEKEKEPVVLPARIPICSSTAARELRSGMATNILAQSFPKLSTPVAR